MRMDVRPLSVIESTVSPRTPKSPTINRVTLRNKDSVIDYRIWSNIKPQSREGEKQPPQSMQTVNYGGFICKFFGRRAV